jgi:KTSC domain
MQTEMIPVQSSLLSAIGYNPANAEFLAQFNSGTLGGYTPTSQEEFETVLASPSVGKAFNSMIKPTKKYRKVEPSGNAAPTEKRIGVSGMGISPSLTCEEASHLSAGTYIACGQPATKQIFHARDNATFAMCDACAGHNISNRGGRDVTADATVGTLSVPHAMPAPEQELEVQQQTTSIAVQAETLTITTTAAHVAAQELIVSISAMKKQVETFFEPMKTAAHKAHKAVCNRETEMLKPLADAQEKLSEKIVAFEKQVEADRKAEEERLRIERQAAAEREAQEEAERLAIEDAIELEEKGDAEGAAAVLANPVPIAPRYVPAPIVPSPISRVSGAVVKETWKARVVNAALVPREWLMVDEAALNKHAANRKQMAVVPGVEFYPETNIHGRSR